jgi:hypothetical protein
MRHAAALSAATAVRNLPTLVNPSHDSFQQTGWDPTPPGERSVCDGDPVESSSCRVVSDGDLVVSSSSDEQPAVPSASLDQYAFFRQRVLEQLSQQQQQQQQEEEDQTNSTTSPSSSLDLKGLAYLERRKDILRDF